MNRVQILPTVVGRWSGRKVVAAIRSLDNAKGLHLECLRVLHETLLVNVLFYGSETMIWREK